MSPCLEHRRGRERSVLPTCARARGRIGWRSGSVDRAVIELNSPRCTLLHISARSDLPFRTAYCIDETALLLGVNRRLVYELLSKGKLKSVRVGARQRNPAGEIARLLTTSEKPPRSQR